LLLAAGEAIFASDVWNGTGATIGGILIQVAATLISIAMLSSKSFGKSTAYVGVTTYGLDLAHRGEETLVTKQQTDKLSISKSSLKNLYVKTHKEPITRLKIKK